MMNADDAGVADATVAEEEDDDNIDDNTSNNAYHRSW